MSEKEEDPGQSGVLTTKMEGVEAVSKEEIEKILKQVDKEASARKLTGTPHWIVYVIGVSWSIFQVYTAAFGLLPAQLQRSIHLAYAFVLTYLLFPARAGDDDNRLRWHNWVLAVFAGYIGLYMALNYMRIMEAGGDYSRMDYIAAGCGILLTLEAARRVVGLPIVCLATFFLLFCYFGAYFPGFMSHRGYSLERIASHMFLTTEGILGIPLGVAATFIYLFILFGSFREKSGLGQLFIDISNAVAGWASGGPAKMAVITSALEGTVSGSSVANTVESGSLTIPMMKRLGYRPEFAAAVEASSSTGGQIMPPIMGAAAFIMAEFLNVPYLDIAKAAAIPACLYFFGVFMEVHFEAKRCNLRGLSRDELPRFADVMKERGHLFVPLFAIIIFLSIGFTPLYAALMGLVTCIIAGALKAATRMSPRQIADGFELGARNAVGVALACASAGIIIGAITLTGLGLKLGNGLVELAGGNLLSDAYLHHDHLAHPRHGGADHGQLHHHLHHRRSGADPTGSAPARGPHVRLLLRDRGRHHAAGRLGCVRRRRYRQIQRFLDGGHFHQACHRGVSDALHFCLQHVHALDRYDLVRDDSDADHVLRGHDGDRGGHDRLFRGADELDRADLVYSRRADDGPSGNGDGPHRHRLAGRVRGLPVPKEKSRGRQHGHRCGRVNENS